MKLCSRCRELKEPTQFNGDNAVCRKCQNLGSAKGQMGERFNNVRPVTPEFAARLVSVFDQLEKRQ